MNVPYVQKGTTSLVIASLAFLAVGCGTKDDPEVNKSTVATASPQRTQTAQGSQGSDSRTEALAVLKGQKGIELAINSVERDAGGFLTVKGRLRNSSDAVASIPAQTSGDETEVVKHGTSLGGATLVDATGKKRYYVLRDTDGRPLTTTGLDSLGPGKSTAVFLQFPAPPPTTTDVSFQLPTFEPATLKIS